MLSSLHQQKLRYFKNKNCSIDQTCKITDRSDALSAELNKKILTKAAIYEEENKSKNKKKYINEALKD